MVALPGLPGAGGAARPAGPKIGDRCLVGTWRDRGGVTSTTVDKTRVRLTYHGGDVDHIHATGWDHDSWTHSKPLVGRYKGHRIEQRIRGHNLLRLRVVGGHKLRTTEKGWSKGSTSRYVYRGHHLTGTLPQHGHYVQRFRCTAKTLTFLTSKGKVVSTETRVSRRP